MTSDPRATPRALPRSPDLDDGPALLAHGYGFIAARCRALGTDGYRARLLLRPVICTSGVDAARMFYRPGRFTRVGAMPPTALRLLQDRGSVQQLDGEAHRQRKSMFMAIMSPVSRQRLLHLFEAGWLAALPRWRERGEIELQTEVERLLTDAVCHWAGVRTRSAELEQRRREFAAMIDGAGSIGPRWWRALPRRWQSERWARTVIDGIRARRSQDDPREPATRIAAHRDGDGRLLPVEVAAVELINLLRPTVAVARYVSFAAHALATHPAWQARLRSGEPALVDAFVQEVRRFYPFFPIVGGRVRQPFDWHGHAFACGDRVLLDLYGSNRDPRAWPAPDQFRPERFLERRIDAFEMVPQGGDDHWLGHRCAGEWLTIELLRTALRMLTARMRYQLPAQDLSIDLGRMPALPASRMRLADVRPRGRPRRPAVRVAPRLDRRRG